LNRKRKCKFIYLIIFWSLAFPWFFYSYFFGKNSVSKLKELRETEAKLEKERNFWKLQNEILEEKINQIEANKRFYYEKLAREMFLKGKDNEEVILFVK